jgi:hypothetical protein
MDISSAQTAGVGVTSAPFAGLPLAEADQLWPTSYSTFWPKHWAMKVQIYILLFSPGKVIFSLDLQMENPQ